MYRSPVKEWHVSWFVLGTITLNGTHITVRRLDRNVKTFSADRSAIFAKNGVSAFQSYCPQNKPADLPLFYWRPVRTKKDINILTFILISTCSPQHNRKCKRSNPLQLSPAYHTFDHSTQSTTLYHRTGTVPSA